MGKKLDFYQTIDETDGNITHSSKEDADKIVLSMNNLRKRKPINQHK